MAPSGSSQPPGGCHKGVAVKMRVPPLGSLVVGGAQWRAHRHLEQSEHGPVSYNGDHRKCSFLQGFIWVLAMPQGMARPLVFQWF